MTDENQESTETEKQEEKTYTQAQIDKAVSERLTRERKKYDKKYAGVDMEAYNEWQNDKEQAEIEAQKKRGEFDKIIKDQAEQKDAEITRLKTQISTTQIDGSILSEAVRSNAIAPDQVVSLLKTKVRLDENNLAEVLDSESNVRYSSGGDKYKVSEMVQEFLTANPHFVKATQSGSGAEGGAGNLTHGSKSVADMTNEEYRSYRQSVGRGSVNNAHIG